MEINKTKDADLMLLGNKELYNKLVNKNEKSIIMKNDFIKYKKEIKTKINELFTYYTDPSNICLFINNNNEDYKYLSAFNSFVNHYIENIKTNNFKKEIQNELRIYNNNNNNKNNNNKLQDSSFNNDFSNVNIDINKDFFNKPQNKNNTLDEFIEKRNINIKPKILPKKRYQK